MSNYPLASQAGITQAAIKNTLRKGITEKDLFQFLHGNINYLYETLPKPSYSQPWETSGKRYVHLEEARFVARHFLRNNIQPQNERALVLSGTDPCLACLPWIMSGIVTSFDAVEVSLDNYLIAKAKIKAEIKKIEEKIQPSKKIEFNLLWTDCFNIYGVKYSVIDLDFCNNQLRKIESRNKILHLLRKISPRKGPFIFRTTLHVGRPNNSKKDIENHIDSFERDLLTGRISNIQYKIRAHDRSPYQSSLPMLSLIWILERREEKFRYY